MKRLVILLVLAGMLICIGCRNRDVPASEPVSINDTPDWIAPDEKGWIWKIGYVPAKAAHEFISGVWNGLCGDEPEGEQK